MLPDIHVRNEVYFAKPPLGHRCAKRGDWATVKFKYRERVACDPFRAPGGLRAFKSRAIENNPGLGGDKLHPYSKMQDAIAAKIILM